MAGEPSGRAAWWWEHNELVQDDSGSLAPASLQKHRAQGSRYAVRKVNLSEFWTPDLSIKAVWILCDSNISNSNACSTRTQQKQMWTKFIGRSKGSKMDTSFLYQTGAGRDLLEVELRQKLVRFKHYFNQLHVTALTTKSCWMKNFLWTFGANNTTQELHTS